MPAISVVDQRVVDQRVVDRQAVVIRPFSAEADPDGALAAFVTLWNQAFQSRRNFQPWTVEDVRRRLLECPAFDADGLFLAWQQGEQRRLVGMAHAFKPAPDLAVYRIWEPRHHLALLYVTPALRGQRIGSRLLQVAENWLYYCPVHVADHLAPCYGALEGLRPPPFGSTERMGIPLDDRATIHFFARHGYVSTDIGDVTMRLETGGHRLRPAAHYDLEALGLTAVQIDQDHPFTGREPVGRKIYTLWQDNQGAPYGGLILTDPSAMLRAHMSWYPVGAGATMALGNLWVAPELRGQGLGRYLLDSGLHAMTADGPDAVEIHTHLHHHARAVAMYEARGFQVVAGWVNLVKR